jgi:hypothetical protein
MDAALLNIDGVQYNLFIQRVSQRVYRLEINGQAKAVTKGKVIALF